MPQNELCISCQLLCYDGNLLVETEAYKTRRGDMYYIIPLHYSFEDDFPLLPKLSRSAQDGCLMCSFLKNALQVHFTLDPVLKGLTERPKPQHDAKEMGGNFQLLLTEYHPGQTYRVLHSYRQMVPDFISGKIRVDEITSPIRFEVSAYPEEIVQFPDLEPLSTKSLRMIQWWIDSCVFSEPDQHKGCPKAQQRTAPKRLIDVMDGDTVRIVETEGQDVQYAILSYCWGRSVALESARTINSNLAQRLREFALSQLPQTLQDAITFTRALKIPYLWIDAICIVQDSGEWAIEAGKMMKYYENSYLTIVPVMCTSADQSFLARRPSWTSRTITGLWTDRPASKLMFYYPEWEDVEAETRTSAWQSRGWTLQEGLLSARRLYIGRNGFSFLCRTASRVEHKPARISQPDIIMLPSSDTLATRSPEWIGEIRVRSKWYQVLSGYIERELTMDSDRLVAISGLAQKIGSLLNGDDEYISGLWKDDLHFGLSWTCYEGWSSTPKSRTVARRTPGFPTWSWCSMNKPVLWNDWDGCVPCIELIQTVAPSSREEIIGIVQCTNLIVKSWLFAANLLERKLPDAFEINVWLDEDMEWTVNFEATFSMAALVLFVYLDEDAEEQWTTSPAEKPHEVIGLLLEPTGQTHDQIPEYRRLGRFEVTVGSQASLIEGHVHSTVMSFYKEIYGSKPKITLV